MPRNKMISRINGVRIASVCVASIASPCIPALARLPHEA
jgi:hypothetical protein